MRIKKEDWFTIPNIMGYIRILLIPVFAWVYLHAESQSDYYIAAGIIGLSGLTDLFDGKIARKFNMVTELGKFLDPLADKLTLGVLILCMSTRFNGCLLYTSYNKNKTKKTADIERNIFNLRRL